MLKAIRYFISIHRLALQPCFLPCLGWGRIGRHHHKDGKTWYRENGRTWYHYEYERPRK